MGHELDQLSANSAKSEAVEWIKAILIAAALVFIIRWFIFAPFIVEGPSMRPNFYTGERLIVNKIVYSFRAPKRGEVIVFHATEEKDYIKRAIAFPGETVKVEGDKVYINGKLIEEPYIQEAIDEAENNGISYNTRDFPESTVPEGTVFAMGDNRPDSLDSRFPQVGFVSFDTIIGRADVIFWPIDRIELIKHSSEVE